MKPTRWDVLFKVDRAIEKASTVVRGGACSFRGDSPLPHVSMGIDIDASRFVSVHVCSYCGSLFAPIEVLE